MAAHTLARCLRTTPSSASLLFTRPSTRVSVPQLSSPIRGPVSRLQSTRHYSSQSGAPSEKPAEASSSPSEQTSTNNNTPTNNTNNNAQTSPPTKSKPNTTATTASKPDASLASFDQIFKKLEIGKRDVAKTTKAMQDSQNKETPTSSREPFDPAGLSRAVGLAAETDNYRSPIRRVELKLGPELGRQVNVEPDRGIDVATAIRNLHINCSANRVRAQANAQRFHVRRGQRRKDIRRERWRRLFKFSFDQTVAKVQRMRAQGW
ncbi:hypothetical protein VTN96DRAFT_974 [Rasamsonia emersonii]|uniref:Ribosomal protein S21 n=1 Tax=Rasamsonia emersonii (strain ATCC 16479 / CBS 393.64 / IMI 116815) TaxID=1408163 RepID=A0A0F4YRT7_RASE3|nr:hypothetical protein T310_5410 [Rasamsonia emersonii CBS 393.64]KKA20566.1 hypothetical protein T310_5410 [Rasamsonia emersonii CBS 393.64]